MVRVPPTTAARTTPSWPLITSQNVRDKRVMVRVDIDVELEDDGKTLASDFKFRAQLPMIHWLRERGAKVVLAGHFGRPEGKRDMRYSLGPMAALFSKLLDASVELLPQSIGDEAEDASLTMRAGEVLMLENLRFYPGETENDPLFAKKLSRLADIYVNNAFANCHRAHASMVGVPKYLPAFAGLLVDKEVAVLSSIMTKPLKPLVLVIGGAKIETKVPVIEKFLGKASQILTGGAIANTLFAAKGYNIQASKMEPAFIAKAKKLVKNKKLLVPTDVLTSPNPHGRERLRFRDARKVGEGEMILDIGPKTIDAYTDIIKKAGTVVWNGPMGLFELSAFAHGTESLARAVSQSKAFKVVGGGETGVALKRVDAEHLVDHLSTGGGAMLEFLGGKNMPALEALGYYGNGKA